LLYLQDSVCGSIAVPVPAGFCEIPESEVGLCDVPAVRQDCFTNRVWLAAGQEACTYVTTSHAYHTSNKSVNQSITTTTRGFHVCFPVKLTYFHCLSIFFTTVTVKNIIVMPSYLCRMLSIHPSINKSENQQINWSVSRFIGPTISHSIIYLQWCDDGGIQGVCGAACGGM